MKIFRPIEQVDQKQEDCFWHDHSEALCYLLVLPGLMPEVSEEIGASGFSQSAGRIAVPSREYRHLACFDPSKLPGDHGPVTVMLVL